MATESETGARPVIYVLNGPNLNMLGVRERALYGAETLADVEALCRTAADAHGLGLVFWQTNSEGELVTWIQEARDDAAALVLNAGAYTHTSIAVHDALQIVDAPIIELHVSNIYRREAFRHVSFVAPSATGVIAGFGAQGYAIAVEAAARMIADA